MENENEQTQQELAEGTPGNGHHKLITALTVILSIILAAVIFMVVWYWGDSYPDMKDFKESMSIPGLDEGATPAGIEVFKPTTGDYSGEEMCFVAANMKDGTSRIYVTGGTGGYYGYVPLSYDGEPFTEGVNGIALDNYTMWVASGTSVYVMHSSSNNSVVNGIISKAMENEAYLNPAAPEETEDGDAEDADAEDADASADADADGTDSAEDAEAEEEEYELQSVEFTGVFDANCNADFIFFYYGTGTNYLYVGETRAAKDTERRITTTAGDTNNAIMHAYQESTGATYGLVNVSGYDADGNAKSVPKVSYAYSIPSGITAAAITDSGSTHELVLCRDNGYNTSTLLCYDFSSSGVAKSYLTYANRYGNSFRYKDLYQTAGSAYTDSSIRVYAADSSNMDYSYTVPPMANALATDTAGTKVYVLFKSGASGYKALVRQITREVYAISLPGKDE